MRNICDLFAIGLSLMLVVNNALSDTSDTMDAEALLKLAPRISLEEKSISTFEVKGTLYCGDFDIEFIVSGKQPDQFAIMFQDPLDKTPVMVGIGDSFMFYDPVSSEVRVGRLDSTFTLSVKKDPAKVSEANPDGQSIAMGFGFHSIIDEKKEREEDRHEATVIDIRSFLALLVKPLEVRREGHDHFVISGLTKGGSRARAYVAPTRKEGPFTRVELYQPGKDHPFLVLDEIALNQPIPAARFSFPKERLLASALSTKQIFADGATETVLSTSSLIQAFMVRFALLAGVDDSELRSTVEKMSMRKLDWERLKADDKRASPVLRSIFEDDVMNSTEEE